MAAEPSPDTEAVLEAARSAINSALLKGDFETAGVVIAKHVPLLLQWGEDTWVEDPEPPPGPQEDGASAANEETESGESLSNSSDDSDGDSSSDSNDEEASSAPQITSYRYRSVMHNPRNPRLEHLCTW